MISHLRGTLDYVTDHSIEVDTGSLGFEVNVPATVLSELPRVGEDVDLFTYLAVKEDGMSLYGFLSRDALEMFKLLITINGIGPKGALSILSAMTPEDIRFAVLSGDAKALSRAPGIGKKTAERMIIELRDKVSLADAIAPELRETSNLGGTGHQTAERDEAIEALVALGYSASDALKAVRGIETEGKDTEAILREALKKIGR